MSGSFQDHYAVLGVSRDATAEEIKRAHRRLIRDAHPDANAGDEEQAKALNEARDVLIDPVQRARFDAAYTTHLESAFVFSPRVLDFGDVYDDGDRETADVRVCYTDRVLPGEPVDFDSEFGSFWRITFRKTPAEDDPEYEKVFYDLTFSTALQSGLKPGEHRDTLYLVSDRGVVGKLPLRVNVLTSSGAGVGSGSETADDSPSMPPDPSSAGSGRRGRLALGDWYKTLDLKELARTSLSWLAVVLLVGGGYLAWHYVGRSAPASTTGGAANSPYPVDSPTLPHAASTAFNVAPRFISNATISNVSPITGSLTTSAGSQVQLTLQPSYSDLELTVQVDATSSGPSSDVLSALNNSVLAVSSPASAPLDFSNVEYEESPIRADVASAGSSVQGTLVFGAALPGSYGLSFGFGGTGYIGVGNVAGPTVSTDDKSDIFFGNQSVAGTGSDAGRDGFVVYMEVQAQTDIVISYGAMGLASGSPASLCAVTGSGTLLKPTATSVVTSDSGNGNQLQAGTMTFPTSVTNFAFSCKP